jgi:hypothetical protein
MYLILLKGRSSSRIYYLVVDSVSSLNSSLSKLVLGLVLVPVRKVGRVGRSYRCMEFSGMKVMGRKDGRLRKVKSN